MASLIIHAVLGLITTVLAFQLNAHLYRRGWEGARVTGLEFVYYAAAIVSVCAGWYFNVNYVFAYPTEADWFHFVTLWFQNPAAGSGAQDLIIANVLLFPLWTMVDGPRRGLRSCWIFFVVSLVTSFACAIALYLAAQERQVRWNVAHPGQPQLPAAAHP